MIEKLPFTEIHSGGEDMVDRVEFRPVQSYEIQHKINELVDFINTIQKEREAERVEIQEWIGIIEAVRKSVNIHEKQIDELQMKAEPEKCEALYEEMMNKFDVLMDKLNVETAVVKENFTTEIPNTEYITITADDVFVGGKPAKEYHGQEIYNVYHCPAYFKEARDIIREENGCELLEIHCLQSSTDGKYAKPGNPIPGKKGVNCWVRIKFKDTAGQEKTSLWVFHGTISSDSNCANYCANYCGYYVRSDSDMRGGLFGSVRN